MTKYSSFIVGICLVLLALFGAQYTYYEKDVAQDTLAIEAMIRGDERAVLNAVNAINESLDKDDLNTIDQVLSGLPTRVNYIYTDSLLGHDSWRGRLNDCDLVRSKNLENGRSITVGWLFGDLDGNVDLQSSGISSIYQLTSGGGDIFLSGNVASVNLRWKKSFKRGNVQWCIAFFLLLSFLLIVRGFLSSSSTAFYVGVPVLYLVFCWLNKAWFTDVSIFHDTTINFTPWAQSLFCLVLLSITFFFFFIKDIKLKAVESKLETWSQILATTFLFVAVLLSLFNFIQSPAVKIDFNELSTLSWIEALGLVCIVSWTLLIFLRTQLLVHYTKGHSPRRKYSYYFLIAFALMLVGTFYTDIRPIWVLPLFIIVYLILSDLYYDIGAKNITWLILWLVVISGFLSTLLYRFDYKRDLALRKGLLQNYYHGIDESDLNQIRDLHSTYFDSLALKIQSHPKLGSIDEVDLRQSSMPTTIDMEMRFAGTTKDGQSIYSDRSDQYLLDTKHYWTAIRPNWYFDPIDNQYIVYNSIATAQDTLAHQMRFIRPSHLTTVDLQLTIIKGDSILRNDLLIPESELAKISRSSEDEILLQSNLYIKWSAANDVILISQKPLLSILKPITLFSFFFCLLTILVIFFMVVNSVIGFLPDFLPLRFTNDTSLSTRIQIIIVGMVIFSFMTIATITSIYLQNQIRKNGNKEIQNRILTVTNNILWHQRGIDETKNVPYILENIKAELEAIHSVEINLFDTNGQNVKEEVFKDHLPYLAYYYFNNLNQSNAFTINENKRVISYLPLAMQGKQPNLYVSLEYKGNDITVLGVVDYLGTLLNVYVFLFLIAGAVALAIAKSITEPLETLANRMKETKLNKKNKPVDWKADDEIGNLIQNYNAMIYELEASAKLLARTERDVAWKEMARNVAHEIKNPLTPMKLSIQFLERAVDKNPNEAIPLVKRVAQTLVEQIDNLAGIADAFSNFGKMPQANNEKVILNEVVETIHDLFRKRDDMDINLSEPIEDIIVFADKNHLISILNNILKNAIQAIPNDRKGVIDIFLYSENENAIIKVKDNGVGISEELRNKVFTPNFTTKSSGSGLGLAISSNMLESFNGTIHFESIENVGSSFFISIPMMKHYKSDEGDNTKWVLD